MAPAISGASAITGAFRAIIALVGSSLILGLVNSAISVLGQLEQGCTVRVALAPVPAGACAVSLTIAIERASVGTHCVPGLIDHAGGISGA